VREWVFCFLALPLLAGPAQADTLPNSEMMSQLRSGKILQEYTRMNESGGAVQAKILIHTKVEDVWAILQGCGKAFIFVDGMEQCEILKQTLEYALVHQVVDTGLLAPTLNYRYESEKQAYERMEFRLVEGNLRVLQGSWGFEDLKEGLLVTYNMRVQPGFPIPRFLVRMSLRRMIPDMLACIRGLVDGSVSSKSHRKVLDRCPGVVCSS
jgi:hypothetical protein